MRTQRTEHDGRVAPLMPRPPVVQPPCIQGAVRSGGRGRKMNHNGQDAKPSVMVPPSPPSKDSQHVAGEQTRRIEQARRLLQPTPVQLHRVPNWLRRRLLAAIGCGGGGTSGYAVLAHAERLMGWRWLDHWGASTYRGQPCFVSEPYHVSADDMAAVAELCRRCNLDSHLSANSWWYPGETIRIAIYEPAAGQADPLPCRCPSPCPTCRCDDPSPSRQRRRPH